ncbi:Ada metal-binding domain-containing protein [Flagellimonas myxillae]|uniref:Ada metal-binding domain-containing protein n=1 Tax=Flagellimonas myxillae TaxID=2942214 RepID=UPI00201EA30A|nr:Ada metal-binding domain-containing protein [Muricauda myxillae]MCL6266997.1 metal-binding protein [Muricauda myxillae]
MIYHKDLSHQGLALLIKNGKIRWGGNKKLKIYGSLHCKSGKRMNMENRVFFATEQEALKAGFRPCGSCMRSKYVQWKNDTSSSETF